MSDGFRKLIPDICTVLNTKQTNKQKQNKNYNNNKYYNNNETSTVYLGRTAGSVQARWTGWYNDNNDNDNNNTNNNNSTVPWSYCRKCPG